MAAPPLVGFDLLDQFRNCFLVILTQLQEVNPHPPARAPRSL